MQTPFRCLNRIIPWHHCAVNTFSRQFSSIPKIRSASIAEIGKAIHMNCSEMFSEVPAIVLSAYPDLAYAERRDSLDQIVAVPSEEVYSTEGQ